MAVNKLIELCHRYLDADEIDEDVLITISQEMGPNFTPEDIVAYSKLEELNEYREAIDFIYNFEEE